jgi:gliding motility-associated-like protein
MVTKKIFLFVFLFMCTAAIMNAQKSSGDDALPHSPLDVFIPNAFTPDGNGLNDSFGVVVNGPEIDLYEFMVLDRNGNEVFFTTNPDENWEGTIKESSYTSSTSMFIYILKIKSVEDRGPMTLRGHVVLIR